MLFKISLSINKTMATNSHTYTIALARPHNAVVESLCSGTIMNAWFNGQKDPRL
jgi:hypothetical protein